MGPLVWYLAIKKYKYYLVWAIFLNFGAENATLGAKWLKKYLICQKKRTPEIVAQTTPLCIKMILYICSLV